MSECSISNHVAIQYIEIVVIKLNTTSQITEASHVDNSRTFSSGQDLRHEEFGQEKMSDVVGAKLRFDAFNSGGVLLNCHNCAVKNPIRLARYLLLGMLKASLTTSVVDQNIELFH